MSLPPNYDEETGTIGRARNTVRNMMPSSTHAPTHRTYSYSSSWWDEINDFVIGIGNWIAENIGEITEKVTLTGYWLSLIGAIIWVIGVFNSDGGFYGILSIVGAFFIVGLSYYVIVAVGWIIGLVLLAFRFVFWNIYTLLLAIGVIVAICLYASNSTSTSYTSAPTPAYAPPATSTYICTARTSLKVRSYPTLSSSQIGSLTHGEEVEVLDISDGFAHVKFNGQDGYASIKYLRKK